MSNTVRTILRNRLRRHPDQVMIAQHIEGSYGASGISDLKKADLIATCAAFGLSEPTMPEVSAFENAKALGQSFEEAMQAADDRAPIGKRPTLAPVGTTPPGGQPVGTPDQDEQGDDDDAPEMTLDLNPQHVEAAREADAENTQKKEAAELVAQAMGLLGKGDFAGFQSAVSDLALRACRPDPEPVYINAPGVSVVDDGTHAKRIGRKTMTEAGMPAPMVGNVSRTILPVYDAKDAPRVDPNYLWPDVTGAVMTQLARARNVFLTGPAGTGKTSFAKQIAARYGRSFVRISCDDQTEAATLVGMTVPDKDGGSKWQDGQLVKAIRKPGTVILVDEPSVARPGALFVLQAALDDDRAVHIAETGEVVHVAPDVLFLLADNTNGTGDVTGAYEATRRLNRATLDRVGVTVKFDYMSQQDEAKALASRTGCDKKLSLDLVRFANLTRQKAARGDVSHPVGLRRLMALAELITDGVPADSAYQMAVIETAPFDDQEPLRQMWAADFKKVKAA